MSATHCQTCGAEFKAEGCATGYGSNAKGERFCYDCCAEQTRADMRRTGRATLCLDLMKGEVTDWAGRLRFDLYGRRVGRHNIAGTRYDVWFHGPEGLQWHGVTYGGMTQLCHCKRLKAS